MKRLLIASAVLAAFAFSTGALAQGYVGASIGQSDFGIDCSGLTSWATKDRGYKLFGGYMFTPYLGAEAGYIDFGKATGTLTEVDPKLGTVTASASLKASGFAAWGVGSIGIGDGALFAKMGIASIKNKLDVVGTAGFGGVVTGSDSTTVTDFAYGVGAAYHFTKNLGVRIEWERFRGKIPDDEKFDLDLLSAGVVYRF